MDKRLILTIIIHGFIMVILLCSLGKQIYERLQTNTIIVSAITSDGEYYYADMSNQHLNCDEDYNSYNFITEHCVDVSEDKICKYNLNYTFAGECQDK